MTGEGENNKSHETIRGSGRRRRENKGKRRLCGGQASNQLEVGVKIIACTLLSATV